MDPFSTSMLQQALGLQQPQAGPTAWRQQLANRMHAQAAMAQMRDWRNPQAWQMIQQQTAGMDPATKYLYAMAHRIPPAAMGFYPQTINYLEQALMGFTMDKNTGQILQQNGDGTSTPLAPGQLQQAIQTRNGYDTTQTGGMALTGINQSTLGAGVDARHAGDPTVSGAYYKPGSAGAAVNNLGGGGVSNIGGGAGNPNNAAGGLYGAAGNALRQQLMDSEQFNPNGANTYAIQNMNLSGLGDMGSNMGGLPSNGLFGGAVPSTALGNGQTSTTPIPTIPTGAVGTQNPGMGVQTPQSNPNRRPSYFGGTGGGLGGGQHNVIQGGVSGGANGAFTGTIDQNGATQYRPPTTTTTTPTTPTTPVVTQNTAGGYPVMGGRPVGARPTVNQRV